MLPPDATEIAGREAIQAEWQSWIDAGLKDLTLEAKEVEANGDLAYEIGWFTLQAPTETNDKATASGNYVVVWKRGADGAWSSACMSIPQTTLLRSRRAFAPRTATR
jgi:ketosteroid isomerase-like protein